MAKLNIVKAINSLKEESLTPKMLHPLYGLKDSKGWLTRYPVEGFFLDTSVIREYLSGGGHFDSCGVWGLSPYEYESQQILFSIFSPYKLGELVKNGERIDFLIDFIYTLKRVQTKYKVFLNPDISPEDFKIFKRGIGRIKFFNPKSHPPVMTIGYWSKQRFFHEVLKRWDFYPGEWEMIVLLDKLPIGHSEYPKEKYPKFYSYVSSFQNYIKRNRNRGYTYPYRFSFDHKGHRFYGWNLETLGNKCEVYYKGNFFFNIWGQKMKKAHRLGNGVSCVMLPVYNWETLSYDNRYFVFPDGDFSKRQWDTTLKKAVSRYRNNS